VTGSRIIVIHPIIDSAEHVSEAQAGRFDHARPDQAARRPSLRYVFDKRRMVMLAAHWQIAMPNQFEKLLLDRIVRFAVFAVAEIAVKHASIDRRANALRPIDFFGLRLDYASRLPKKLKIPVHWQLNALAPDFRRRITEAKP
jgi:hypothetical protein